MSDGEQRSRRVVLKSPAAERDVQRFVDELGWPRLDETEADIDNGIVREVVWGAGSALTLHYTEDPVSVNNYVIARGHDKQAVDALAQMAEARLDTWHLDELVESVGTADDPLERARRVIRVGVGAPDDFREDFFRVISAAMDDPDPRVREAGIYATAYSSYPQYRPILERLAHGDPDETRREDALIMLESFDAEGVAEP